MTILHNGTTTWRRHHAGYYISTHGKWNLEIEAASRGSDIDPTGWVFYINGQKSSQTFPTIADTIAALHETLGSSPDRIPA